MSRPWSTFKMLTIANVLALALGACAFQPPTGDDARQPAKQTGCPTPTPLTSVALEAQESAQASVSPAQQAQEATTDIASADDLSPTRRRSHAGPSGPGASAAPTDQRGIGSTSARLRIGPRRRSCGSRS